MPPKEYRGRLSTGCERCRSRRIKCDEGKPSCVKCDRAGFQCEYRDVLQITFRNENPKAAERAQKTWRARVKTKPKSEFTFNDYGSTSSEDSGSSPDLTQRSSPFLAPVLKVDIMDCAVNRFFFDYILPEASNREHLSGIFDYLPPMFAKSAPDSSLKEAMYAVSLANFDRRSGCALPNIRTDIDKHYGNALRLVAKEVKDPASAQSNQLLLAVQMLGVYEQMSSGGNNIIFLQAHAMGMAALIKGRKHPIVHNADEWRIIRNINGQMLSACLKLGIPSFIPYATLKHIYDDPRFPLGRVFGLVHQSIDLLALWKSISYTSPANEQAEKATLLQQMATLDNDLNLWENALPPAAIISSFPTPAAETFPKWLRSVVEHPGMPPTLHRYDSVQVIYIWSLYRTMRFAIARVLLMASLRNPIPGGNIAAHQDTIQRMTEDTCSSILPIFTQFINTKPSAENVSEVVGFRPMMAILPLNTAKMGLMLLPDTPEYRARKQWVETVLAFIMMTFHNSRWVC